MSSQSAATARAIVPQEGVPAIALGVPLEEGGPGLPKSASTSSLTQLELYPGELQLRRAVAEEMAAAAKAPASQPEALSWALSAAEARAIARTGVPVPVAAMELDVDQSHGQPRPLDAGHVAELVQWLQGTPPLRPCTGILLLQLDTAGARFVVLGGQHTVRALQCLREESRGQNRAIPAWQEHVLADVLHPGTSWAVCRKLAGRHQWLQQGAKPLALHHWAASVLRLRRESPDMGVAELVRSSVEACGLERPTTEV